MNKTISYIKNNTTGALWDIQSQDAPFKKHSDTLIHLLNYMQDNDFIVDIDDIEVIYKEDADKIRKYNLMVDAFNEILEDE